MFLVEVEAFSSNIIQKQVQVLGMCFSPEIAWQFRSVRGSLRINMFQGQTLLEIDWDYVGSWKLGQPSYR